MRKEAYSISCTDVSGIFYGEMNRPHYRFEILWLLKPSAHGSQKTLNVKQKRVSGPFRAIFAFVCGAQKQKRRFAKQRFAKQRFADQTCLIRETCFHWNRRFALLCAVHGRYSWNGNRVITNHQSLSRHVTSSGEILLLIVVSPFLINKGATFLKRQWKPSGLTLK